MNLQDTFYVIGIVYMSIGLVLMVCLVVAVLVIKGKIDAIHQKIDDKLRTVSEVVAAGEQIYNTAKDVMGSVQKDKRKK